MFHTGENGAREFATARETLARVLEIPGNTLRERIVQIAALRLEWGEGNGT